MKRSRSGAALEPARKTGRSALLAWTTSVVASLVFLLVLALVHWLHGRFFRVDVVLYSALLDVVVAAVITSVLLLFVVRLSALTLLERVLLVSVWLLAGYALALTGPTVIDRSLSFYLLEKLQQRGGAIQLDRMEDVFVREYVPEHRLVSIRLTEQVASGTVIIDQGCVRLTERGQQLATFSRWYRAHWLPRQRLIGEEYSDALVDPFRDSGAGADYRC